MFRYGPFFINKDGLGSLVYASNKLSLLALGILEGEPYKSDFLEERKKGIFLGTLLKYDFLQIFFYKDFFKDKGYNLKTTIAPEFYLSMDWKFSPQIFVQYWNTSYVNYYFGVKPTEVDSGMNVFNGHQTVNYGFMLEATHFVNNWIFVIDLGIKSYGKEVYTSPTVVKKNEIRFITSVLLKLF